MVSGSGSTVVDGKSQVNLRAGPTLKNQKKSNSVAAETTRLNLRSASTVQEDKSRFDTSSGAIRKVKK